MSDSELHPKLIQLIRYSLPTFPAAELLVFLAEHSETSWTVDEIVAGLHPRPFTRSGVADYLSSFQNQGLIRLQNEGRFVYQPSTPELREAVALLELAYNEQPVTLIRCIYVMADHSIQSFADSFRIKNTPQ